MASDRDPASAPPASTPSGSPAGGSSTTPAKRPEASKRDRKGRHEPRDPDTMIPARSKRLGIESFLMRIVATVGIVAIGVAIAAIMVGQDVQGWIVGLVVSVVSVL